MIRIAHCADIHIDERRREEYAQVFAKLYLSLRKEKPDVIVVAGDVFNVKAHATPHNLEDVSSFLVNLADIAPVVLTAGNHDVDVNKPGSLDLLSPLVKDHRLLQPPRLTFWRSSGTYAAHGMAWTVIATDGEQPSEESEQKAIVELGLTSAPHICLFHEEVNGAIFANGMQIKDFKLTKESVKRYDLTMAGHIHLRQRFTARAAYCGSLVQQNIGETHNGHGYVLWNVDVSTAGSPQHAPYRVAVPKMRGVDVPNPCGFVRIEVDASGADVTPRPIPDTPLYWELIYDIAAPTAAIKELTTEYVTLFAMQPRAVRMKATGGKSEAGALKREETKTDETNPEAAERKECSRMVEAQAASRALIAHEPIIRELLAGEPAEVADAVVAMHNARYHEPGYQVHTGARVRILRFEFDDIYAYEKGNAIDFVPLEGCVSGIAAENSAGKSSFIEGLAFALYEIWPRAPVKANMIHQGARSCRVMLEFELDGKPGRIEKSFTESKIAGGKSEERYRFEYAGEDRTRGGIKETVQEIAAIMGTGADALATSFQLQGCEAAGFMGMHKTAARNTTERKELIMSALSLGDFEALGKAVAKEYTESNGAYNALTKGSVPVDLDKLQDDIDTQGGDAEDLRAKIDEIGPIVEAAYSSMHETLIAVGVYSSHKMAAESKLHSARGLVAGFTAATVSTGAECAEAIAQWEAAIEDVTPDEEARAPASEGPGGRLPRGEPIPTKEQIGAELAQAERLSITAKGLGEVTHAAALALAAAAPPKIEPPIAAELVKRTNAALVAARKAQEAPSTEVRPVEPAFPRPEGGAPGAQIGVSEERKAARPTAAALAAALKRLQHGPKAVTAWNAVEHARCLAIVKREIPACASLEECEAALQAAHETREEKSAAAMAAKLAEASLNKLEPHLSLEGPADLQHLARELGSARAWASLAGHADSIRARLQLRAGCAGCEHTAQLFDAGAVEQARLAVASAEKAYSAKLLVARRASKAAAQQAAAEGAAAASAAEAAAAAREEAAAAAALRAEQVAARAMLTKLDAAKLASDSKAAAEAVVAAANYHHTRDAEQWESYTNMLELWSNGAATQQKLAGAAVERATERLANAERAFTESTAAAAAHAAAKASHASAHLAELEARGQADAAAQAVRELTEQRASALAQLLWWRNTAVTVAAATAAAAELEGATQQAASASRELAAATAAHTAAEKLHKSKADDLAGMRMAESTARSEAARLENLLSVELARVKKVEEAASKRAVLKAYKTVLSPNTGIGAYLLEKGRTLLERRINDALRELDATFTISITPDFNVYIIDPEKEGMRAASLGGGYQRFAISLAARLTLWRLSSSPCPDAFIIDEGFTSCDAANLEKIATAINALAEAPDGPRLVFVVSHLPRIKMCIERALNIEMMEGGSRIVNTAARPIVARAVVKRPAAKKATATKDGAAADTETQLLPDPEKAGNVYCEVCDKSLQASRGANHLTTKVHLTALSRKRNVDAIRAIPGPR